MKCKYYIINKPYKVLSQFTNENGNVGLKTLYNLESDIYPVGRLDLDSEGLLILTNDKELNKKLLNPQFRHERTYMALVEGIPSDDSLKRFSDGLEINLGKGKRYTTLKSKVRVIENYSITERDPPVNYTKSPTHSWLEIKLIEGKNRQVRKMTAAIGHPTLRLIRVSVEALQLKSFKLMPGEIKAIERNQLYKLLKIS